MAGPSKKLRINRRFENQPCAWCGDALVLGEEGAVCEACETPHHARCWDEKDGCGLSHCLNAPLRVLEVTPAKEGRAVKADEKPCPHCGKIIYVEATICRYCNQMTSVDGLYHGPTTLYVEARNALIKAIVSIFCCGIILAPLAISDASNAKKVIDRDPSLTGRGLATAAQIIGVMALIFWVISLLIRLGGIR